LGSERLVEGKTTPGEKNCITVVQTHQSHWD
jgi:hypothetical protein